MFGRTQPRPQAAPQPPPAAAAPPAQAPAAAQAPPEGVFSYFDGEKTVFGDPLRVERELYQSLAVTNRGPDEVFAAYASKDPALWMPAVGLVVEAVRRAFAMAPFDPATGRGATEAHCRDAVEALWDYLDLKKKPTAGSVTSSAPTTAIPGSSPLTRSSA